MAVVAAAMGGGDVREFVSPLRILVRSFRLSRDQWKAKSVHLKVEVKRLKVNVHDVQQSRAAWRQRAALRARMAAPTAAPPKKSARGTS